MQKLCGNTCETIRQALPFIILSGLGEIVAGLIMSGYLEYIELVPGVLVLLPSLMNLRGAISSSLAARLGSAYHLGMIGKRCTLFNAEVKQNIFATLALALIISFTSAVFSFVVTIAVGLAHISLAYFLFISMSSSIVASLLLSVATFYFIKYSIRKGIDPDNVTIPVITTAGDIVMVLIVYITIVLSIPVFA